MAPPGVLLVEIPGDVAWLDLVQGVAEEVGRQAGLDEDQRLDLGLAVREGTINAIEHGHRDLPGEPVRLTFRLETARVRVEIADRGPGFDPARVPDPTDPENLLRPSGRGLLLIRSLVDTVDWRTGPDGTTLILEKLLGGGEAKEPG